LTRRSDFYFNNTKNAFSVTEYPALEKYSAPCEVNNIEVHMETTKVNANTYSVSGSVSSPNRAGVGGLRVQVVDKNAGEEDIELAVGETDALGAYRISYSIAELRKQGKQGKQRKAAPDIQLRAFSGKTFLGASEVRYNATADETLDVPLPASASRALPTEHETLTGAVAAHYKGKLRDLKESGDRQDITYLANKTGWDARAVALAALADQHSHQAGAAEIPPACFYALFRAGLPADEQALYRVSAGTLTAVLKAAVEQGVIPPKMSEQIPQLVRQFQVLGAQKLLAAPAGIGISSLTELLAGSRLDNAQQKKFADLYASLGTDMPAFWKAATKAFGEATAARLQTDGKLSYLTINNAPLIAKLHRQAGPRGVQDTRQLAELGYHRAGMWDALLAEKVAVPAEIPGDTPAAKRANYADYLAAHVRLSNPTGSLAEMVKSGDFTALKSADRVHAFLYEHQDRFAIGVQPVEQYIAEQKVTLAPEALAGVKALQRVYQLTPDDRAMTGLLNRGVDAAYHVVRYQRESFVQSFAADLGGAEAAAHTYDRAVQVHHAVLNVALSYATASNAPGIGVHSPAQIVEPLPPAAHADDVIAYATLESLFGSMDFCACEHCRSLLSPAAYLVDLLSFIDQPAPPPGTSNPQTVLAARRPDLLQLPLTCENTNVALPYIDVVNEALEYFVANNVRKLSLNGYTGHDTGDAASEDLLASPQYVMDAAYMSLAGEMFPPPLPFHQPLENLRRYFNAFDAPLPLAMERVRKGEALDRGANPYGWRDILMETIGISRAEYAIFTDATAVPLWRMYGFPSATADAAIIAALSGAKAYCQRVGIDYADLVAILKTRFVNPASDLVPKLARLGVEFVSLDALHRTPQTILDAAFNALLPTGAGAVDVGEFGGDTAAWEAAGRNYAPVIRAWLNTGTTFADVMGLLTLTDPTGNLDACDFDALELRFARPMAAIGDTSTRLGAADFVRLLRFIRLWKKTGWTIEQTDSAICALFRADLAPLAPADVDTTAKLDAGFAILIPRVGVVIRVMDALQLPAKRALLPLLACWSPIGTHGDNALYRQLFLNPALLRDDPAFGDNGYGGFLTDATALLAGHAPALKAACSLSGDDYDRIVLALAFDGTTHLTLANISAIYRIGYLARILQLSVRELLLLMTCTGLDPFGVPDVANPAMLQIITLVHKLKDRGLKTSAALYLIWNQDLSGNAAPTAASIAELARALRGDFAAIEDQFAVTEDPGGDLARARMTLVYGQEASDAFFALLDDTLLLDVPYTHGTPALGAAIGAADAGLGYDNFRHRLTHAGLLEAGTQAALKAVAGVSAAFRDAVDLLFARSEDAKGSFFTRFPELQPLFTAYITSANPPAVKRSALLAAFRPELARRRKRQQALQRIGVAAGADEEMVRALMDPAAAPGLVYPLHASAQPAKPAMNDVLALETPGLTAEFYYRNTATGGVGLTVPAAADVDYSPTGTSTLPPNPVPGTVISGIWRGSVETPESGYYNFVIEADAGATVALSLDGVVRPLTQNGLVRRNTDPIELSAGMLCDVRVTVEAVKDVVCIKWETPKRPRQVIPARYLYPTTILGPFTNLYVRLLKATSLAAGLGLSAREMAHLAIHPDYRVGGDGWLNVLPVAGAASQLTAVALLKSLQGLLDYARIKTAVAPDSDALLDALRDPAVATATPDSAIFAMTGWDPVSLAAFLGWFGRTVADLTHVDTLARVYDACLLRQSMGIAAAALLQAATNEPTAAMARDMEAALRARYAPADWREVVRPINDALRGMQRDALVAYILHQMRSDPTTAHIDTADKLFEYFLMDVQMEPCTQTSRIRHALSSVQLFIERCLMNQERNVSPASINAAQWEWMKRYRVWEANRKVFLFPENWLEPELRDDKSPFFKEIESELLQSDITDNSATSAVLNYLSKLEEVAKLEPCGIHHIEGNPSLRTGDVDHVVARTAGAHRKYYYRRYEYGYWTPWEQVKLDIEDNPAIPVVWRGRLLLVWLRVMKQGQDAGKMPPTSTALTALTVAQLPAEPTVRTEAALCWSEYYNGKWQPTKTSDVRLPTLIRSAVEIGTSVFQRRGLVLTMAEENDALRIGIIYDSSWSASFLLYNTHSLPVRAEDQTSLPTMMPDHVRLSGYETGAFKLIYGGTLVPDMYAFHWEPMLSRDVLHPPQTPRIVEPHHAYTSFEDPFFYEDSRHVFFVTTTQKPVWIRDFTGYTIDHGTVKVDAKIPDLVYKVDPRTEHRPPRWGDDGPVVNDPRVVNPAPMQRLVTEDAYIRQGLPTAATVRYGGKQFGPSGAIPAAGHSTRR
jgi:hypothetical protein